jgi:hypothetical protein
VVSSYHDELPVLAGEILIRRLDCMNMLAIALIFTALSSLATAPELRIPELHNGKPLPGCQYVPTTSSNAFCCARNMMRFASVMPREEIIGLGVLDRKE